MTWKQTYAARDWNSDFANWMGQLDDDVLIRDLSIPGTHDTAAKRGSTHFEESETQTWTIEQQLNNGIRFLDLRVKRKGSDELAMWHGGDFIWDYYDANSQNQLYFRTVYAKCVEWLAAHPRETIIVSIKDEEHEPSDFGTATALDLTNRVYTILTEVNRQYVTPTGFHGMWHNHDVSCTLGQTRGRVILWRRFAGTGGIDDLHTPGVDLVGLSEQYDNTKHAHTGHFVVQDYYKGSLQEKAESWLRLAHQAYASRHDEQNIGRRYQPLNFASKAGKTPQYNANVMNLLVTKWLGVSMNMPAGPLRQGKDPDPDKHRFRSGYGVIPFDFPDSNLIDYVIRTNFRYTYDIDAFEWGHEFRKRLIEEAATKDT